MENEITINFAAQAEFNIRILGVKFVGNNLGNFKMIINGIEEEFSPFYWMKYH